MYSKLQGPVRDRPLLVGGFLGSICLVIRKIQMGLMVQNNAAPGIGRTRGN